MLLLLEPHLARDWLGQKGKMRLSYFTGHCWRLMVGHASSSVEPPIHSSSRTGLGWLSWEVNVSSIQTDPTQPQCGTAHPDPHFR